MAWDNLAKRFKQMPLLLAGPILRDVTPKTVTVWVATLRACEVTLTVYASGGPAPLKVAEGVRTTTAIGKNLHILAVTATVFGSKPLSPGTVYLYDLKFLDMGVAIVSLQEALDRPIDPASPLDLTTDPFTLGYGSLGFPSFSLPPSDPNKVRIMHGSCRRAHGEAGDALTILDDLISATASKADERPHQLYLTGDQIYADDVADSLLLMLTDAGDTLLGWTETLPAIPPFLPPGPSAKLPPYSREKYLKAVGFTSEDLRSHLMSLGEYLAMYLFAWSDALWPTNSPNPVDTVPTFLDIVASVHDQGDHDDLLSTIVDREKTIRKDISNLRTFRDSLPQVRKALANIPTYMICDDHEVTDDWNMTREFCEDVYGHDFGVRVMQNALVAFALCQAWGNQPDQFDPTIKTPTPPNVPLGARLLQLFGNYEANSDEIRKIVGVNTTTELKADAQKNGTFRVFHDASPPLRYNFIIDWPAFVMIVSDTRSWRSFPEPGSKTQPDMLGPGELANQLTIPATDKPKIIVFTTNAPPIRAMRKIVKHPRIAGVYDSDLYDSWQYPSRHFDQMIVQLTGMCPVTKVPLLGQMIDKCQGQVMILSGDYHYSFASRMDYWAVSPLGQTTKLATLVVGQLVSSPFRNESKSTRGHQDDGYTYTGHWYQKIGMPDDDPEGYAGWNMTGSASKRVGTAKVRGAFATGTKNLESDAHDPTVAWDLAGGGDWDNGVGKVELTDKPDYRYRLEYLSTFDTGQNAPTAPPIGPVAGETPRDAAKDHAKAAAAMRGLRNSKGAPPAIVGLNNIAEITLQWDLSHGHDRRVFHTLRCRDSSGIVWARYDISLNPDDPKYPLIKANGGEP